MNAPKNPTLWLLGYRGEIMDSLMQPALTRAAANPTNLAPDFIAGARAAEERAAVIRRHVADGTFTHVFKFNRYDWGMCDVFASVEASAAYSQLVNAVPCSNGCGCDADPGSHGLCADCYNAAMREAADVRASDNRDYEHARGAM